MVANIYNTNGSSFAPLNTSKHTCVKVKYKWIQGHQHVNFLLKERGNEQDVATNKGDKQRTYNIHISITQKNHTLNILFTTSSLAISNNEKNTEQIQRTMMILDNKSPNHNTIKCQKKKIRLSSYNKREKFQFQFQIQNTKKNP
jgi:hypothetical protein